MRSAILGFLVVVSAGCAGRVDAPAGATPDDLQVHPTGTPFVRIEAGPVTGLIPDGWIATPIDAAVAQHGFVASPGPEPIAGDRLRPGLSVTWVDATQVGVPSDFFYMTAAGSMQAGIGDRLGCEIGHTDVVVNRAPAYLAGGAGSPGDFVASGHGSCVAPSGMRHRWSYFVAAPGFGPVRELGITASGLYVATAVTRATPGATMRLRRLLGHVRFDGDGIWELVRAARPVLVAT